MNEMQYKKALDLMMHISKHDELIAETFQQKIYPFLSEKKTFLDVGPGAGKICKNLKKYFVLTEAVEPNKKLQETLSKEGISCYSGEFRNYTASHPFNFILCSHVLYHFSYEQIKFFVNKMWSLLTEGGACLIVMASPKGTCHKFKSNFHSSFTHSGLLAKVLTEFNFSFEKFEVINPMTCQTYEESLNLANFMVFEDCFLPEDFKNLSSQERNEIQEKIKSEVRDLKEGSQYNFFQTEDHFLLWKKKSKERLH